MGHPMGQLTDIGYVHTRYQKTVTDLLLTYDDPVYGISIETEPCDRPMLEETINWSTVDIDKPYAKCDVCGCTIEFVLGALNLCHVCNFHATLSQQD